LGSFGTIGRPGFKRRDDDTLGNNMIATGL
jgi:hypothetical protein